MKVVPAQRKIIYSAYKEVYFDTVGLDLVWKKGEKKRAFQVFTRISEGLKERDPENFEYVFGVFLEYVFNETKSWIGWDKKDRSNYLGFIDNKDKIAIYTSGIINQNTVSGKNIKIAGVVDDSEWDF